MELNINQQKLQLEPSAKRFVEILKTNQDNLSLENSFVYHNFPLYKDSDDGSSRANILILSPNHGVMIIECSGITPKENSELKELKDKLEQTYNQVYSKLIKNKSLRQGRNTLKIELVPVLFLPNFDDNSLDANVDDFFLIANDKNSFESICEDLVENIEDEIEQTVIDETRSTIEGAKGIIKVKERNITDKNIQIKASFIRDIELEIANFDGDQKRAALTIIEGPQRIRGLAGSGKTIILAWKAALLHMTYPEARIIYTFTTKSLGQLIKQLVTRFYRQYSDVDPNWDKISILHGWGGKSLPGVYSTVCVSNGIPQIPFPVAQTLGDKPFDEICKKLIEYDLKKECDFILIDEAQDFPASFYQLCLKITENDSVIWGYDECQNILDVDLQDPKKTFGKNKKGEPLVDLSKSGDGIRNDIILHKCYRNPRNILHAAFALGFGLYGDKIVQMLESNDHWEDLGFKVVNGDSSTGSTMKIVREEKNSPILFDAKFPKHENIICNYFEDISKECKFIADSVSDDLKQGLTPDDIVIICVDDRSTRAYFSTLIRHFNEKNIPVFNIQDAPFNSNVFKVENHITLSTVYKAKGNEAASVYVLGIDSAYANSNFIVERNKIFTALTRAKCWLTITGIGNTARDFKIELEKAQADYPYFNFIMPDKKELRQLQRDIGQGQAKLNQIEKELEDLAKSRGVSIDDILEDLAKKKTKKSKK